MTAHMNRLASKSKKVPFVQVGQWVIEGTRFLFASIVLVYVVMLLSPPRMVNMNDSWIKPFTSSELTDSLVLELRPVLEENDVVEKVKTEIASSHLITLSSDSFGLAERAYTISYSQV
jgi:hypothetical protein